MNAPAKAPETATPAEPAKIETPKTEKEPKKSKEPKEAKGVSKGDFVHKTGTLYHFPGKKLVIVGLDTPHVMGAHPLWRADAKNAPSQALVDAIRKHGVLQPGRCRKIDDETAEVVMGRDRVKSVRILNDEGIKITMPMLTWPAGTPIAEIIGAANAENYQRKHETMLEQVEHVWMELVASGFTQGREKEALAETSVSTGFSPQRLRYMVQLRGDEKVCDAIRESKIGDEIGMALASIGDRDVRHKQLEEALKNPDITTSEMRERVGYAKQAAKAKKPTKGGKKAKASPKKDKDGDDKGKFPGIGKALAKRIIESQMALPADERNLDQLVIKAMKAQAGIAPPTVCPGMAAALKRLSIPVGD